MDVTKKHSKAVLVEFILCSIAVPFHQLIQEMEALGRNVSIQELARCFKAWLRGDLALKFGNFRVRYSISTNFQGVSCTNVYGLVHKHRDTPKWSKAAISVGERIINHEIFEILEGPHFFLAKPPRMPANVVDQSIRLRSNPQKPMNTSNFLGTVHYKHSIKQITNQLLVWGPVDCIGFPEVPSERYDGCCVGWTMARRPAPKMPQRRWKARWMHAPGMIRKSGSGALPFCYYSHYTVVTIDLLYSTLLLLLL